MSRRLVNWMKRYGFWPIWAVFTLAITGFSVLVSLLLMLLLLGDVSRRGLLIGALIPLIISVTVQRSHMNLLYELDESRSRMDLLARTDDLSASPTAAIFSSTWKWNWGAACATGRRSSCSSLIWMILKT
jgi:hypothetical protein